MNYLVEISAMNGDGLADEHLSRFESNTPIPAPAAGDRVIYSGVEYIVASRLFTFYGNLGDVTYHIQVFCRTAERPGK